MVKLLSITLLSMFLAIPAYAGPVQISAFAQTSGSNTITASANGTDTATTITATDAQIDISQLFNNAAVPAADFSLSASSIDLAQTVAGLVVQHFDGTFCLTSGPGCTGINYLSGIFTDAAVGQAGGPGLVVNVNNPPDSLTLSSSVIDVSALNPPSTFDLTFSNVNPVLNECGNTICSFTASFSGSASANAAVPEPASIALLGLGLLGLSMIKYRGSQA